MASNVGDFEEWAPDDAVGQAEETAKQGEGGGTWKPKPGSNRIRILPTKRGLHPAPLVVTFGHYVEIPGKENGVGFVCPRKMKTGACPACTTVDELRATGNPADFKRAGAYLVKQRVYCNIIDRADEDRGVQVYAFGKTVYEPLMAYRSTNPRDDMPFDSVKNGYDVIVTKTGEKMKTEYGVRLVKSPSPLSDDPAKIAEWSESLRDLRPFAFVMSADQIRAKLSGDEDEDDRPHRGRPALNARGSSVVDHMSDVDDDVPAKKAPGKAAVKPQYVLHDDD